MSISGKKIILLVEDDRITAKRITKILEKNNYSVIQKFSGEEAITVSDSSKKIDLLLTDIDLGIGIDGTAAAEKIVKYKSIPVLFLTSHIEPEIVEKTEKITSYGYVVKNTGETVLIASIKMAFKLFEAHEIINSQKQELEASNEKMLASMEALQKTNDELIITQKKLTSSETHIAEANNMLQLVLDTIPARIFWKGLDFKYLGCNRLLAMDAGLSSSEEMVGLEDFDTPWKEQAELYRADDIDIITTGQSKINYEEKLTQINGKILWLNTTKAPLKDIEGKIIGILGTWEDITDKKKAMEELKISDEKFRNIFETMTVGYFKISMDGNFIDVNPACLRIFGYDSLTDAKIFLSNNSKNIYADPDDWLLIRKRFIETAAPTQQTLRLLRKDGSEFTGSAHLKIVFSSDRVPLHIEGLIEDITERIKTQELLIQTEKMITVAGLAAGMAHEINNPLGIIMQNAENARNRIFGNIDANINAANEAGTDIKVIRKYAELRKINNYLSEIHEAGTRAAKIVENMLQFSRKTESNFTYLNVNSIIDKAINLVINDYDLKKTYDFRKILITKNYGNLSAIQLVETQIEQVFLNLFKNAAQAISYKEFAHDQTPELKINTYSKNNNCIIEISDNGPGMDEAVRKKIFEPFYTTKDPGSGTGLGLSVSFYIVVTGHGGTITAESSAGKGSTFIISLPESGRNP